MTQMPEGASEREMLLAEFPPPRRRWRTLGKIFLALVLAVLALALLVSVVFDYTGSSELAKAVAAAKAAGVPLSYSDPIYAKWGAERSTARTQNAAVAYEEAFALFGPTLESAEATKVPFLSSTVKLPEDPRQPIPDGTATAMRDFVWANTRVLDLMHEGARVPECYFTIKWDGPYTLLPHLSKARQSARLIAMKICIDAEEGHPSDGVSSVCDGLALAKSLQQEPTLISDLVSAAVDSIVVSGATRLLARTSPSNEDLLVLQDALSSAAQSRSFRTGYVGEVAMQQDCYDRFMKGEVPWSPLSPAGSFVPPGVQHPLERVLVWFMRGKIKEDRAFSIRMMLDEVDAAGNPTVGKVRGQDAWLNQIVSPPWRPWLLSRYLMPALSKAIAQCETDRARLRAAAVCCAAIRYRNDNGKWPELLETLVPEYLDKAPLDPFTGTPLAYTVDANGVKVYSVGPNLVDDLGRPSLEICPKGVDRDRWAGKSDDAGFRAWR